MHVTKIYEFLSCYIGWKGLSELWVFLKLMTCTSFYFNARSYPFQEAKATLEIAPTTLGISMVYEY
jgi:hypothetical protein